jgi:fatty acid desaturase
MPKMDLPRVYKSEQLRIALVSVAVVIVFFWLLGIIEVPSWIIVILFAPLFVWLLHSTKQTLLKIGKKVIEPRDEERRVRLIEHITHRITKR